MPNAYTEKLKKKSTGDYIYPVTKASATYMADDDTTVEGEFQKVHGNVATIEETSTASKAYVVGDYLVFGGKLYQVTAAISSGDTLTVGTNIAVTSVGDELKELNSKYMIKRKYFVHAYNNVSYVNQTVDVTENGYKAIGVVGWQMTATGYIVFRCDVYTENVLSFSTMRYNNSAYTANINCYVDVMYQKI